MKTDKEILDWIEEHPYFEFVFITEIDGIAVPAYWRRVGRKDEGNCFSTLRKAIVASMNENGRN